MKSSLVLSVLASIAAVNALSECILDCQSSVAEDSGCSSNYNTTLCYCSSDFATNVKACLYQNSCDSDVSVFYNNVDDYCNGDEETTSTTSTTSTVSDTGGTLGTCVLGCQASAATEAGCSSNYNETSCYCDNDDFALDVKACLYQNCSDYVSVFYNYRSDVCDTQNSTEYRESQAAAAESTATSTAASTSATSSSSTSANSGSTGLSSAVKAGIAVGSIVGGLAIIGAFVWMFIKRRSAAKQKKDAEAMPPVKQINSTSTISGLSAVQQ